MIGVVKSSALSGFGTYMHILYSTCLQNSLCDVRECGRTQTQIGVPSAGLEIQSAVRQ